MSSTSPDRVARELQTSIGLLVRRLRQVRVVDDLSQPESTALASLVRNAPATSADLARLENISAQSMHATITTLEGTVHMPGVQVELRDPERKMVFARTTTDRFEKFTTGPPVVLA